MSSTTLFRWAAAALIVSAALTAPGFALHPPPELAALTSLPWVLSHVLLWLGAAAAIAGVVGLYLRQREQVGTFGAVGAGLAALGLGALSGAYYCEAVLVPALAADAPPLMETFPSGDTWRGYLTTVAASGALVAVGFLLFGTAMLRSALLPRWATALVTLGSVVTGLQFLLPRPAAATLAAGLIGLGLGLWSSVGAPGRRAGRAVGPGGAP